MPTDAGLPAPADLSALAALWRWQADAVFADCPLYVDIARGVADDPDLLGLTVDAGTAHAQFPNMLMAAVHELVLRGEAPELADAYAGRSDAPAFPLFREAALDHRADLLPRLATRFTNTNEVGRSALIVPALAHLTAGWDEWVLVEAGASAGVNLCFDRYRLDYGDRGALGDPGSAVHLSCEDRTGTLPVPEAVPSPVERVGLDRDPVDLTDPDERRWLLACSWPGSGRVERAAAAHEVVAADPPRLVRGEVLADLPALLAATRPDLPVVVLTTWVVSYLAPHERVALADLLAAASVDRPVTWLTGDGTGVVPLDDDGVVGDDGNVLGATTFRDGRRGDARVLADCHAHGRWVAWRGVGEPTVR